MSQKLKVLSEFGAINTNNNPITVGTGAVNSTGGSVTLGSTAACAFALEQGSFAVGTTSHPVNFTLIGKNIVPSSQYSIVTTGTTVAAGVRGVIINGDLGAAFAITFPSSPVDGQLYSVSIAHSQTTYTMTSGDTMVPASITTSLGMGMTFMYDSTGTTWYLIA